MKLSKSLSIKFKSSESGKSKLESKKSKSVPNVVKIDSTSTLKTDFSSSDDDSTKTPSMMSSLNLEVGIVKKVVGRLEKPTKETKVGIALGKDKVTGAIMIRAMKKDSLLSTTTDLRAGQMILSINGSPMMDAASAAKIIAETVGVLTIEAAILEKKPIEASKVDTPKEEPKTAKDKSVSDCEIKEICYTMKVDEEEDEDKASSGQLELEEPKEEESEQTERELETESVPEDNGTTFTSRRTLSILGTVVAGTVVLALVSGRSRRAK